MTDSEQPACASGPNPLLVGLVCVLLVAGGLASAATIFGAALWMHGPAPAKAGTPGQRAAATSLAQMLNGQVALYKLQHADRCPNFGAYPNWEQLTGITDINGNILATRPPGAASFGPYYSPAPRNPLNGLGTVAVVSGRLQPGDVARNGAAVGFVYSLADEKVYVTDALGTRVFDPTAPQYIVDRSGDFRKASAADKQKALKDLDATVMAAQAQIRLYVLQHHEQHPDFEIYPGWDQMIARTDGRGGIVPNGPLGPYFPSVPFNPVNGQSKGQFLEVQQPDSTYRAAPGVGFLYDADTMTLWGVDPDGALIPHRTGPQPAR